MNRTFSLIGASLLCLSLSGCVSGILTREAVKVNYYQIDYPAKEKLVAQPLAEALLFRRMKLGSASDRTALVYGMEDMTCGTYAYDEWISSPDELIFGMLQRDLVDSGIFSTLTARVIGVLPDYALSAGVFDMYEKRGEDSSEAVLGIHFTLTKQEKGGNTAKIVLQKRYMAKRACEKANAVSYVQGICQNLEEISGKFLLDAAKAIAAENEEQDEE